MKPMKMKRITVNTPLNYCDAVREALGKAGAGRISSYSFCSFSHEGVGRCLPNESAKPFNNSNQEKEERIESFCSESELIQIIGAVKVAHPYEEPVISVSDVEFY